MLTIRGTGLLVAAAALWAASRLLGVPELSMAALTVLLLVAGAVAYTRFASASVHARRWVQPPRLFHEDQGTVEVQVLNTGRLPTAILQLHDEVPDGVGEAARFVVSPISAGGRMTLRYPIHGRLRGRYRLGPLEVRLRDPFGIAARPRTLAETSEVIVYPPVWKLPPGMPLGGHESTGAAGRTRPTARGDDLANVREYVRGDDLRKVHWRSTAHRGKLMVRQDESRRSPQATVVLDLRHRFHLGAGAGSSLEQVVTAGASITYHLAERSYSVKLFTEAVVEPPPSLPWQVVLERLATVESTTSDLRELWQQFAHGVGGEGTLVTVTTVPRAEELRGMVRAGRGFSSRIALLVDADSYGRRPGTGEEAERMATALQVAGWRVGVLRAGDRLDEVWRRVALQRRDTQFVHT